MTKTVTLLILFVLLLALAGVMALSKTSRVIEITNDNLESARIRVVTAYTVGREVETDSRPCEGAFGNDLCKLVENGGNVCANNEFPRGTVLKLIELNVECVVLDRMNSRYKTEIDLAGLDYQKNLEFGRKEISVIVK